MPRLLIKICGMSDQAGLDAASGVSEDNGHSADFCGFIFHPASPRCIAPEAAGRLDTAGLARVGVFVRANREEVARTVEAARLDLIQLHGDQGPDEIAAARDLIRRRAGRRIGVIRTFWPARHARLADLERELDRCAEAADLFLLDSGTSGGGSGRSLDPHGLADLRSPRPWLLAGGLTPENAPAAAAALAGNPMFAGLDVNSGLEDAPGHKNPARIRALLHAVRRAETQGGEAPAGWLGIWGHDAPAPQRRFCRQGKPLTSGHGAVPR